MKEIIIHGRGGQGAVLAAQALASAAVSEGKYAMAFPHFGAERRGAPVAAFARMAEGRIHTKAHIYNPDYVIVLDPWLAGLVDIAKGMEGHSGAISQAEVRTDICQGLNKDGAAVLNTARSPEDVQLSLQVCVGTVDATTISLEALGHPATNSTMLGAFAKTTEIVSIESVEAGILDVFGERLGKQVAERNAKAARMGYEGTEVGMSKGGREFPAQKRWLPDVDELPPGCAIESQDVEYAKLGPGSTVQNETGSWRTFHPIVDDQKCTYCLLCWFHCPDGCIKRVPEKESVSIDYFYCKGCGICSDVCPVNAVEMTREVEE
jgi:pyruvate ferredoxin oxidoreductase gamma subunit